MPLSSIFKKRKDKEKKIKQVTDVKGIKEKKINPPYVVKPHKESIGSQAYSILKNPHVTEKSSDLAKKNQYVFQVGERANKTEIKKSVAALYGVDVLDVKTIKIPRKFRRKGKQKGWKKGYKKAIIKIKEGQKIEVLPR